MYGDTSEPQLLQTTKRSGPLAMDDRFYAYPAVPRTTASRRAGHTGGETLTTLEENRSHGARLRRKAVHPGVRPPRVVPEEDVRDPGRSHARGDRDDRRREAPYLRGHGARGPARGRRGRDRRARRRAVRLRHPAPGEGAGPRALDAGREVRPGRVRLPVRSRLRRAHRQAQRGLRQGPGPLQPRWRPGGERAPARPPQGACRLAARQRRQVPVRAPRPGRTGPARGDRRRQRPLRRRAAPEADAAGDQEHPGLRDRGRRLEDRGRRRARGRRGARPPGPHWRGPRERRLRAARARRVRRQGRPLAPPGGAGRGLRRLRDRPVDLVGRAQGLPRRRPRPGGGGGEDRRQLPPLREGLRRRGVRRTRLTRARLTAAALLAAAVLAGCGEDETPDPQAPLTAQVVRVSDGDTIRVRLASGREERVRYIGVDAPETEKPGAAAECYAERAAAFNAQLVADREVRLVRDA